MTKICGYGPATFTAAEQTSDIYNAIKDLKREELSANYGPNKMAEQEAYPDIWQHDPNELEYYLDYFDNLKDFYKRAA